MKTLVTFFMVVAFGGPVLSQVIHGSTGKAINLGRIQASDGRTIDGQHMVITGDSVEYYVKGSSSRFALNLTEVKAIQEYRGNRGQKGIVIGSIAGAAVGIAVSLATIETNQSRFAGGYIEETRIQLWPILVFTSLGSVMGYLVGKSSESWETVYSKNASSSHKLGLLPDPNLKGIAITYRQSF